MTKTDIINYVTMSPWNTNKAVLSDILDEFALSDNKEEIELSATENKVYTPADGKVYKKVTVDVPVESGSSSVPTELESFINEGYTEGAYLIKYTSSTDEHWVGGTIDVFYNEYVLTYALTFETDVETQETTKLLFLSSDSIDETIELEFYNYINSVFDLSMITNLSEDVIYFYYTLNNNNSDSSAE